ncbi:MAG: PepSY domain-containing protein [Saprospiraceae bacterium]|nr:PepSY domain-containing protein [Saprospiraceae bacterium]
MKPKHKSWFKWIVGEAHLWLGLASGIIVFVICLTGSVLAFQNTSNTGSIKMPCTLSRRISDCQLTC